MGLFFNRNKKPVTVVKGEYFGTHPDIKGHQKKLVLIATGGGIFICTKKQARVVKKNDYAENSECLHFFEWSQVNDFILDVNGGSSESSRVTATRAAAIGVLALAAKKNEVSRSYKNIATLITSSGNVEIEYDLKYSGKKDGLYDSTTKLEQRMFESSCKKFRIFVADHKQS